MTIQSPRSGETTRAVRDIMMSAKLVLVDLDGCLAFGGIPHPAAAALLEQLGSRYAILSNNSTQTPISLAKQLRLRGLAVDPARIILAGALMIEVLSTKRSDRSIALFAVEEIENYALSKGLLISKSGNAELVALARDTSFTYEKLQRGAALLASGAEFFASNPDLTHPGHERVPIPETGALLRAFRACAPEPVPTIIGKPSAIMFETALERFGGTPDTTTMIGDNPTTDGLGAEQAGIRSLLIGPGNPIESIAALIR